MFESCLYIYSNTKIKPRKYASVLWQTQFEQLVISYIINLHIREVTLSVTSKLNTELSSHYLAKHCVGFGFFFLYPELPEEVNPLWNDQKILNS